MLQYIRGIDRSYEYIEEKSISIFDIEKPSMMRKKCDVRNKKLPNNSIRINLSLGEINNAL